MNRKTRRALLVLLTLLVFIAMPLTGVAAESYGDDDLLNTSPIISITLTSDEGTDGEKVEKTLPDPDVSESVDENGDTKSDSTLIEETPPAETSLDSEQKEENEEGTAQENEVASEPTIVGTAENSEEEIKENENNDTMPDENSEDAEPLTENEHGEEMDQPDIPNPTIHLKASFDGEKLTKGIPVTITATIGGIPEGMTYDMQWRNNVSGEFRDVPGETGMSVTFVADERNVNCSWQLVLKVTVPEAGA